MNLRPLRGEPNALSTVNRGSYFRRVPKPNAASFLTSVRSRRAESGDVAEGRKAFELAAFERRDKPPQG
jgi:hypothetical protein